ncbi:chaplin family protein [Streptomyces sp. CWNU-52B]|uniref:chaplin family protein n=1 Tax=unclassified Streptomyces TaxID=2593676 RepID=UPI0039BED200
MRQTLSKGMVAAAAATSILSLYGTQAFADSNASGVTADSPGVLSGNNVQAPVNVPVNACGNSVNAVAALNPAFGNSCATPTGKHRKPDAPRHEAQAGHGSDHGQGSDHGYGQDHGYGSDHGDGSGHHGYGHDGYGHDGYGHDGGGASAHGDAQGSPGVGSGNGVKAPVDVPVNACGNSVDLIGLLNPVFGNKCANDDGPKGYGDDDTPPTTPPSTPPTTTPPTTGPPPTVPPTTGPPATTPPSTPPSSRGPELAHTGSDGMLAASAAGVGLLIGGAVLYRRNRVASHR